jgi:hypothetical protein
MVRFRPPPWRRTRSAGTAPPLSTSLAPVVTVLRDISAVRATAVVPPRPNIRAAAPFTGAPTSKTWTSSGGHRTLKIVRKGGKHAIVPLAPRTSRALDLYIGDRRIRADPATRALTADRVEDISLVPDDAFEALRWGAAIIGAGLDGWRVAREARDYLIMRCACGKHRHPGILQETLHKTPSLPGHFRRKADRMIAVCSLRAGPRNP